MEQQYLLAPEYADSIIGETSPILAGTSQMMAGTSQKSFSGTTINLQDLA